MQMNEKEELKQELEQELQWAQYRQKMLNIMDMKLLEMRGLTEQSKRENFTAEERLTLNVKINYLASQVRGIDSESKRKEDEKILK